MSQVEHGGDPEWQLQDQPCAEQFLLWAMRSWVAGLKAGASKSFRLQRGFELAGMSDGLEALDLLLGTVATGATRTIDIRCIHCRRISADERALLAAIAVCQTGATSVARSVFRCMLVAAAARIATSKATDLASALTRSELFLRQPSEQTSAPKVHFLEPRAGSGTVH